MSPTYVFASRVSSSADPCAGTVPSQIQVISSHSRLKPLYDISRVRPYQKPAASQKFKAQPYDDESMYPAVVQFNADGVSFSPSVSKSKRRSLSVFGSSSTSTSASSSASNSPSVGTRLRRGSSSDDHTGPPKRADGLPRSSSTSALTSTMRFMRPSRRRRSSDTSSAAPSVASAVSTPESVDWTLTRSQDRSKYTVEAGDLEIGKWVKKDSYWVFVYDRKPLARLLCRDHSAQYNSLEFGGHYDEYLESLNLAQFMRLAAKHKSRSSSRPRHHKLDPLFEPSSPALAPYPSFFDAVAFSAISLCMATSPELLSTSSPSSMTSSSLTASSKSASRSSPGHSKGFSRCSESILRTSKHTIPKMIGSIKQVIL